MEEGNRSSAQGKEIRDALARREDIGAERSSDSEGDKNLQDSICQAEGEDEEYMRGQQ